MPNKNIKITMITMHEYVMIKIYMIKTELSLFSN